MTAKRQWVLITALLCLAVLAAGFMLLVKPQHSKASSIKAQTAGVQSQIAQLQAKLALLTQEKKDITGEQAKLSQYVRQLPPNPQEPTLLRKVQEEATAAKVDLATLNPSPPAAYTPAGGAPVAGLEVIPVTMSVTGSYFEVEEFLDDIEGLQRSMLVNSFTIGASAVPTSGATTATVADVSVNISASVFMSTSIGQAPAPAPTTAAAGSAGSAS